MHFQTLSLPILALVMSTTAFKGRLFSDTNLQGPVTEYDYDLGVCFQYPSDAAAKSIQVGWDDGSGTPPPEYNVACKIYQATANGCDDSTPTQSLTSEILDLGAEWYDNVGAILCTENDDDDEAVKRDEPVGAKFRY
ncbi:hypothetical protein BDV96DRAFT_636720 [Lophiotrema nucula]|uniref:AA1-like domain-containing protein n=1 Tax=Lophiotrema nucula TaxID=690887 RepID=A0A6A5YNN9_9PLEO|nr:hypothetical protein BDV96DRAFT_636720 [Lophiotrema nucula]